MSCVSKAIKDLLAQQEEEEDYLTHEDYDIYKPIPGGIDVETVPMHTVNCVLTGNAGHKVNQIAYAMACGRYGEKSFPAVVTKAYYPRTTDMVFSTGKFVITGAKTVALGIESAHRLTRSLSRSMHKRYRVKNLILVNLVKSCNIVKFIHNTYLYL